MLGTLTTNALISALLVWSVSQHAADGRYVDADDFTSLATEVAAMKQERREDFSTLAAEVTAMKEERFEFNERITDLELKLSAGEAKLKAVEERLSNAEAKVVSTEKKLHAVEGQLNDALARIDELERNSGLSRDQEVTNEETSDTDSDQEADLESKIDTKTPAQKSIGLRERSVNDNLQAVSKREPSTTSHVAFSLYLNGHLRNLGNQHTVKFDGVHLNQGNGYDAMLGVFNCPVSGVYVFQSALLAMVHDHIETEIVKEGVALVRQYAAGSAFGHGYDQGFNSIITTCNQGERVWVRVVDTSGTIVHGAQFSSFSGYLLWNN